MSVIILLFLLMPWLQHPLVSAPPSDLDSPPAWMIWIDGTQYVPAWSWALEGVLQVMKPGETGLLLAPGSQFRFVRSGDDRQLNLLLDVIRPNLEMGANRFVQLTAEMRTLAKRIEDRFKIEENTVEMADIKGYLFARQQLLSLYGEAQQRFWKVLEEGPWQKGARLVVLVQQFDVPVVSREALEQMREGRLREWVLELQENAPWEEKGKKIKQMAGELKGKTVRVDGFYIRNDGRNSGVGIEISRAFYRGVARLCKGSGGGSWLLKNRSEDLAAALIGQK